MGSIYLRKYGVAATVDFCLYELDGTDLVATAASATGDINLIRDEAAPEQLDADAFVDEGVVYSLVLSIAEMAAARITVYIIDQSSPKIWLDKVLIIETYGHASGQHVFDLASATVTLSSATEGQIDAIETDTNEIQGKLPTNKIMGSSVVTDKDDEIDAIKAKTDLIGASVALETGGNLATIAGKLPTNKIMGSSVVTDKDDEIDAIKAKTDLIPADITTQLDTNVPAIKTMTDKIGTVTNTGGTATIGAILGDVANSTVAARLTTLDTIIDNIHDTDLPDVHTDVGTAITNIGTVDTVVDAIKTVTDALTLAAIADAIHDETTETGVTLRRAINIILAACAGKSSGGGTSALAFRDQADTKARITATVDSDGNRTAITNDGA